MVRKLSSSPGRSKAIIHYLVLACVALLTGTGVAYASVAVQVDILQKLPSAINLKVPFTSQAPYAIWDEEHEEFCEEAAVLMVARYWKHHNIMGKADAERSMQELKRWELKTFGFFKDTTAKETARILKEFYKLKGVVVLKNPSTTDIKRDIAAGHPVIVPSAGRELRNPNFTQPGPLYHMLVIKGYRKDGRFITNDPGTRRGADYVYNPKVIMNAMHDWNGGDVARGAKAVIVVRGV